MVQEALGYDAVYAGLAAHLGAPPGEYLRTTGRGRRASRLVEPVLAPLVRSLVGQRHPQRLLDVGCGTGVYLARAAWPGGSRCARPTSAAPSCRGLVRPGAAGPERLLLRRGRTADVLRRLRGLPAPGGALVLASLFAGRSLAAAHYDLLFRATAGCGPLPRRQELDRQLRDAGFTTTGWVQLIPLTSFQAVVAEGRARPSGSRQPTATDPPVIPYQEWSRPVDWRATLRWRDPLQEGDEVVRAIKNPR